MPRDLIGYDPFEDYDRADIGAMELVGDDLDDLLDIVGHDDDDDYDDEDDVGDELELDDDDDWIDGDDEIGARRRRRRRGSGGARARRDRRAALIRRKRRRGLVAARARTSAGRQIFFGGNATQGALQGVLTLSTKVQELCRVTRLFIVADDGAGPPVRLDSGTYGILDIKVGVKSQFTALEAIPGILFDANNTAQFTGFEMDTIQPGTDFSVQIADAPALARFKFAAVAKALR